MLNREDVQKVIDEQIAPRLATDGGGVEVVDVTAEGVVQVRLQGACRGCPGARMTLQMGVEKVLKEALPEVKGVEAV